MRLNPAAGSFTTVLSLDGIQFSMRPDGSFDLPPKYVFSLLTQGWTVAIDEPLSAKSADFPTTGLVPGFGPVFHLDLGKPLWRNTANSGWVDATGTGVVP